MSVKFIFLLNTVLLVDVNAVEDLSIIHFATNLREDSTNLLL
jgi:hypothetical protein